MCAPLTLMCFALLPGLALAMAAEGHDHEAMVPPDIERERDAENHRAGGGAPNQVTAAHKWECSQEITNCGLIELSKCARKKWGFGKKDPTCHEDRCPSRPDYQHIPAAPPPAAPAPAAPQFAAPTPAALPPALRHSTRRAAARCAVPCAPHCRHPTHTLLLHTNAAWMSRCDDYFRYSDQKKLDHSTDLKYNKKAGAIMCKPNAFAKSDCGTGSWNLVRKSYEHCPAGILSKPPAPRNLASLNPMDLHHKCVHVREKSSG